MNNTKFMVGPEVEHTPAFSKKTLFVIDTPHVDQIEYIAREHKTPHIHLGAKCSFGNNSTKYEYWDTTITALLDKGFWVTLEYPSEFHSNVIFMLNNGIWQSRLFVPLLNVKIPGIDISSPNLTVKIGDADNATNIGVWCLHFHELTDSNRFTGWNEYDDIHEVLSPNESLYHSQKSLPSISDIKNLIHKNDISDKVGLDLDNTSRLKPDVVETTETKIITDPIGPGEAAAAYAEGAKEDPLGKEGSRKIIRLKK